MALVYFELMREFFESTYVGDTILAALLVIMIAIIFLLFMGVAKDVIFLVPLPIFIALGAMANAAWLSVIAYILAGVYFANIILPLLNRDKA